MGVIFLEDAILKYTELGIVGIFALLLLTKGLSTVIKLSEASTKLAESQAILAKSIDKLTEKVACMDTRLSNFGYQIQGIEKRLDKLEENSTKNFGELRDLIKSKRDERRRFSCATP